MRIKLTASDLQIQFTRFIKNQKCARLINKMIKEGPYCGDLELFLSLYTLPCFSQEEIITDLIKIYYASGFKLESQELDRLFRLSVSWASKIAKERTIQDIESDLKPRIALIR